LSLLSLDGPVFCAGANGYIGGGIVRALAAAGVPSFGGLRSPHPLPAGVTPCLTGHLANAGLELPRVSAVIHAAGLGHRRGVGAEVFRRENVEAAVNVARAARAAGATKFIVISTAYIHGRVHAGTVTDTTPPNPMDAYAESKLEAEHEAAAAFGPGFCAVRPAAVIGPAAPGNLSLLLKLLSRGIPLPFGGIANRRSFIERDDLAALILAILRTKTPPESVLAAHPETIGTTALIQALAEGLPCRAKLFACPPGVLATGARICGRAAMWQSLSGDFIANPVAARALGWAPAEALEDSLRRTARYYNTTHKVS
jgi:nucleoside-diphosphate-sugar epimerase